MKAKFIKKLALGFFAVSVLGLYSCAKDDAASVITKSTPSQESTFPAGEIARVSLKLSMGHLHGRQDFHFVPSSGKYDLRNIYDSQEFTFEKKGDSWTLVEGSPYSDFIAFQIFAWDDRYSSIAPDYGSIIRLYDASGKLINDQYTSEKLRSQFQLFFYPTDFKTFGGKPVAADGEGPTNLLRYVYCDTNVWDKSASKSPEDATGKKLYTFLPKTEPIGIKGYYQFPETGRFLLNIDLWYSPKGKLEGDKPSPFFAPNAVVKSGKQLLHLTLPVSVPAQKRFMDEVIEGIQSDYNRRVEEASVEEKDKVKPQAIPLEKLTSPNGYYTDEEMRTFAQRMMMLLGTKDWNRVAMDFYLYYTSAGQENTNEGYF
jgi:hypothetical protein